MTIEVIYNGEDGLVVRNKLNNNFAELKDATTPGVAGTATYVDGTETFIASQDGNVVDLTAQQVSGTPFTTRTSLAGDHIRDYTDFSKIRPSFASTNGGSLDLEPFVVNQSGTGARAGQASDSLVFSGGLELVTGTTNTGYVSLQQMGVPLTFANAVSDFDFRAEVKLPFLPVAGGENYTFRAGFFLPGALPATTQEMTLYLDSSSPNWKVNVRDAAGFTRPDSGVAAQTTNPVVLRAKYDPIDQRTRAYIDGVEVQGVSDFARTVDLFSALRVGFILQKTEGTTSRSVYVNRMSTNILYPATAHFE